jgi:uncharacterized RDD family membrane protein YckC
MATQGASIALAPADLGARLIAVVIDSLVLGVVYLILITFIAIGAVIQGDVNIIALASRSVLFALIGAAYFAYGWTKWKASPGQRVMGLQTVNADDGRALTGTQALTRWAYLFGPSAFASLFTQADQVGGFVSFVVQVLVLVYYIYLYRTANADPRRQGFHDKQVGSIVVKVAA